VNRWSYETINLGLKVLNLKSRMVSFIDIAEVSLDTDSNTGLTVSDWHDK
jgi:hypothetical protein